MASKALCRGPHPLLVLNEATPLGAWVSCATCGDSFHATTSYLEESYHHATSIRPPSEGGDFEIFIHEKILKGKV